MRYSYESCGKNRRLSQVNVIYTNFTKAFDGLDHSILLHKLDMLGFATSLLQLFQSYLRNRYQLVQYQGFKSDKFLQVFGVPQGSVLGSVCVVYQ